MQAQQQRQWNFSMAGGEDSCIGDLLTQPASEDGLLCVGDQINLIEHDQVGPPQLSQHRTPDILVRGLIANRRGVGQYHDPIQPVWRCAAEIAHSYRISDT